MRTIFVEKNKKDLNLINYISEIFPSLPKNYIHKALRNKDIKVNDLRVNRDVNISISDKIDIYIDDKILFNLPKKIDIVFEDENLLAVYKPQGILSNNESEEDDYMVQRIGGLEPTFDDIIKKYYPNSCICHRLDRNTSGILIFAKNNISTEEILRGFKEGIISKEYTAYVSNSIFAVEHETLEKYILKDFKTGFSKVYDEKIENSKKISTEYTVIYKDKNLDYAILKILIHTGKTHQIRAQMANIGHPIIGDSKYGKNEVNKKFKVYKQLLFATKYTFNFDKNSPLFYLNDISIELDKNLYSNKLGCDLIEKDRNLQK